MVKKKSKTQKVIICGEKVTLHLSLDRIKIKIKKGKKVRRTQLIPLQYQLSDNVIMIFYKIKEKPKKKRK